MIHRGAKREDATVLDVSLSGLSVQTALTLSQGDEVELEVTDGRVRVRALAWNARRVRRGQETTNIVGMMLAEVGPDYESLVMRVAGSRARPASRSAARPAAGSAPGPPPQPERCAPPALPGPRRLIWWRLRIKQTNGPRTRVVTLAASSAEDAASQSLAEMGGGWEVIEVRPARG